MCRVPVDFGPDGEFVQGFAVDAIGAKVWCWHLDAQ
jgi:hypothetical protein